MVKNVKNPIVVYGWPFISKTIPNPKTSNILFDILYHEIAQNLYLHAFCDIMRLTQKSVLGRQSLLP